jgi:DNA-binding CsgD family transcriptional regulator
MQGSVAELVGREPEQAEIEEVLERAQVSSAVLVLEGEPGVGKTTLWRFGVELAIAAEFQVLATQPAEVEAKLTYSGLADLLTPYADAIGALPGPQRRSLRVALRLQDIEAAQPDETAVALATLNLIRSLATDAPVLIGVDDVQWLDAASAEVLTFVLRRLRDEPVAALLAVRSATLEPRFECERLSIGGLDSRDFGRLLRTRLNVTFPPPVVDRIREACGGNPFFGLEIARELQHGNIHVRPGEPLPLPPTQLDLLEARVARVSPTAHEVLLVVAAAATIREQTLVERIGANAADAVAEAMRAELLVRRDDEVRFSHPLLRSTVYDLASSADRHRVHRELADQAHDEEERARHLALATDRADTAIADALERAARSAAARGAFVGAADLAEQAATLTPDDEREALWQRLFLASEAHYRSANFSAARVFILRAQEVAPTDEQRSLTLAGLAALDAAAASPAIGAATFRRALAEDSLPDEARADVAVGLTYLLALTEPIEAAAAAAEEALVLARRFGNRVLLSQALARRALIETLRGDDVHAELMERALELECAEIETGALPGWNRTASVHCAEQLIELGEFDAARPILVEVCDVCREYGVQMLAWPLGKLAALEQRAGNWPAALQRAEDAVEFAEETGDTGINYCRTIKAHVHAARGEADAARAELERARRYTQSDPMFLRRTAGFADLIVGNAADAHAYLASATRDALHPVDRALSLPDQIEASLAVGALERGQAELAHLEAVADTLDRPLVHAAAARCRGMLADASGDVEAALRAFETALEWHYRVNQRFELSRTLLARGIALRHARRPGDARRAFERAELLFDQTASQPWVQRTHSELARLGGRPAQTGALTPTERQIAELVAAGKTNAEVARALHVSPKTVEWNLSKVYKKFRVTSRSELAATFAKRSA